MHPPFTTSLEQGGNMGAHKKQAVGLIVFLAAFVVLAGAFATASILLGIVGAVFLAASIFVFLQCKALEQEA
jgi:hypothetical protein